MSDGTRDSRPGLPGPDWVRDAVFYQIFPDRFANGDPSLDPPGTETWGGRPTRSNFFGGDLAGLRDHVPHLRRLGVNALYLTPIFAAGTNHRYDTIDYRRIDPALGDAGSFREAVQALHGADVRVVLDAVFHHCGDGHPAFRDVVEHQAESKYVNWFYAPEFPIKAEPEPNYLTCSGCAYLPKLNVYNPAVRQHLFDATRLWTSAGIDGWRLDVPFMMENPYFWREFRRVVKGMNPDAYIVAEVWGSAADWVRGDTSDGAMNYQLRDAILDFVTDHRTTAEDFAAAVARIDEAVPASARGLMLNLLGSHDTERVKTRCGGDPTLTRFAFALLFAAEGAPMIYYGDEVGMEGFNDPDCRQCMVWEESAWDHRQFAWLQRLIQLRAANVALRRGGDETLLADGEVLVRAREHPSQTVLCAANRGPEPVRVGLAKHAGRTGIDLLSGEEVKLDSLLVPAREVRFVEPC